MTKLLIYGATGYTGKKLAVAAQKMGLNVVLSGRNTEAVRVLAEKLGLEWRSFSMDDKRQVERELSGVTCVLNAASPYLTTAKVLMDSCIEVGSHYADFAGELEIYEYAEAKNEAAVRAGVMLMPGVAWHIVATDCLALHTARRADRPHSIRLFVRHVGLVPSRGSIRSMSASQGPSNLVRQEDKLTTIDDVTTTYDVGFGVEPFRIAPLPDVITTWKTTGLSNISVYAPDFGPGAALSPEEIDALPEGGTDEETAKSYALAVAEVTGSNGEVWRSTIKTISGYAFTSVMGAEVARRVLRGDFKPGFQTPAGVYGPELACSNGAGTIADL